MSHLSEFLKIPETVTIFVNTPDHLTRIPKVIMGTLTRGGAGLLTRNCSSPRMRPLLEG
jgi:hypothetical protein